MVDSPHHAQQEEFRQHFVADRVRFEGSDTPTGDLGQDGWSAAASFFRAKDGVAAFVAGGKDSVGPLAAPEEDGKQYKVGDKIIVKLDERGKVQDTIRAVYQESGKMKLNIYYGHQETATIRRKFSSRLSRRQGHGTRTDIHFNI